MHRAEPSRGHVAFWGCSVALSGARSMDWVERSPAGAGLEQSRHEQRKAPGAHIQRLEAAHILPSMSRAGCPYDNAMAESFMKTLKTEEVDGADYRNLDHAKQAIGMFIETAYNRQRLHSALAYLSPMEFETKHLEAAAT